MPDRETIKSLKRNMVSKRKERQKNGTRGLRRQPIDPIVRFSVLMGDGDHQDMVGFDGIQDLVSKLMNEASSYLATFKAP